MNEPYKWNYNIKIRTKEGTYEYEDKLENIETLLEQHQGYEEVRAEKSKSKVLNKKKNTNK